jgi:hypothetical protein
VTSKSGLFCCETSEDVSNRITSYEARHAKAMLTGYWYTGMLLVVDKDVEDVTVDKSRLRPKITKLETDGTGTEDEEEEDVDFGVGIPALHKSGICIRRLVADRSCARSGHTVGCG